MSRKIVIVALITGLLFAGGMATWMYYFSDLSKKTPIRAKQVFLPYNIHTGVILKPEHKHKIFKMSKTMDVVLCKIKEA